MMKAIDKQWGIQPQREKALMLARREVAAFVCDAVNLEGLSFTLPARCRIPRHQPTGASSARV
jgi:hypothetical protein